MPDQPTLPNLPPDGVILSVLLAGHDEVGIARDADRVADPTDSMFGQHISRPEVMERLASPADASQRVTDWLGEQGIQVLEVVENKLILSVATPDVLVATFGHKAKRWIADNSISPPASWPLPTHVRGYISSLYSRDAVGASKLAGDRPSVGLISRLAGAEDPELALEQPAEADDPSTDEGAGHGSNLADLGADAAPATGWSAQDIRTYYNFPAPDAADGAGECVALLSVGVCMDIAVLEHFWKETGVERTGAVVVHNMGWSGTPPPADGVSNLEAYMTAEWLGAMAPAAKLVIYNINPEFVPDMYTAVVTLALADKASRPSVLVTSWTMPEKRYAQKYGLPPFEVLLDAAALVGMSVVCASGDWGVYDGRPQSRGSLRTNVCYAPWPQATFPACCERVLGIGGSMITQDRPRTEAIWSGPLPPYKEIRDGIPLTALATSGGFSEHVAIPDYQSGTVAVEKPCSRGTHQPAVVPFGRGIPDVSIAATGASVTREGDDFLSSMGYKVHTPEGWMDFGGGTSTGAPVWGAIIALINQKLVAKGLPRLGQPHAILYRIAARRTSQAFKPITNGASDVRLKVVTWDNRDHEYVLPGFEGHSGRPGTRGPYAATELWNPATGLGVPNVTALIDEVVAEIEATVAAHASDDG